MTKLNKFKIWFWVLLLTIAFSASAETLIEDWTTTSFFSALDNYWNLYSDIATTMDFKFYSSTWSYIKTPTFSSGAFIPAWGTYLQGFWLHKIIFEKSNYNLILTRNYSTATYNNLTFKILNKETGRTYFFWIYDLLKNYWWGRTWLPADIYFVYSDNFLFIWKNGYKWFYIDFSSFDDPEFNYAWGFWITTNTMSFNAPVNLWTLWTWGQYIWINKILIDNNWVSRTCSLYWTSNKYYAYSWSNNGTTTIQNNLDIPASNGLAFWSMCDLKYEPESWIAGFSYFNRTLMKLNYSYYIPGQWFISWVPDKYLDNLYNSWWSVYMTTYDNAEGLNIDQFFWPNTNYSWLTSVLRVYNWNTYAWYWYYRKQSAEVGCVSYATCIYSSTWSNTITSWTDLNPSTVNNNVTNIELNPNINNNINITVTGATASYTWLTTDEKGFWETTYNGLWNVIYWIWETIWGAVNYVWETLNNAFWSGAFGGGDITGTESYSMSWGINFGSWFSDFNTIPAKGINQDCELMFSGGVFQYTMWTKNNFLQYQEFNLFESMGFNRWELKVFSINIIGWIYDILSYTTGAVLNFIIFIVNTVVWIFDFVFYLFNAPTRGADYCFFWETYKIPVVIETTTMWTVNNRQLDIIMIIFIIISLMSIYLFKKK